jgi:hypothetical protein
MIIKYLNNNWLYKWNKLIKISAFRLTALNLEKILKAYKKVK